MVCEISSQRCHALTVADGAFSHKIDYVTLFIKILKGIPNCSTCSEVTAILLNGLILLIVGASSGRFWACSAAGLFYNVEFLYPLDKFQTNRGNIKQNYHFHRVADTIKVLFFFYVSLLKIKFVWNSSNAFAVILPQQRPVLVSAHAQNFFS